MTLTLYLYDAGGNTVGTANHLESSFSVDLDSPNGEELRDLLADLPELDGVIGPSGGWEADSGLYYPIWGEDAKDVEDPETALENVGSVAVSEGLADSYELIDE